MAFVFIILGWIFFSEALILILSRDRSAKPLTHILVLGANGDSKSALNQERARKALEAKKLHPKAKIIISGNEKTRGEVTALLQNMGSQADGAIKEELSTTTLENIEYSKVHFDHNSHALIVTSDFHTPRAVASARLLGLEASPYQNFAIEEKKKIAWWTRERAAVAIFVLGLVVLLSRRYFKR